MQDADVMIQPPRTLLEVFKQLPEGTPAQLIENKLIMSPAPVIAHQQVAANIFTAISNYVAKKNLGIILFAPVDVYFNNKNIFEPDIIFVANENLHKIKSDGVYGAPDLIVEILSPSSIQYDLKEKKKVYEQYGVKEYWVIDPDNKNAQGFFLHNNHYAAPVKCSACISSPLLNAEFNF